MTDRIGIFALPAPMNGVEAVRYVSELGAGAFEPLVTENRPAPGRHEAERIRAEAEKRGVALPCLSAGVTLTGPQGDVNVDRLRDCADAAKIMGIPYLHHTICLTLRPEDAKASFEQVLEETLPRVRAVYDYAADCGVQCIYEDQGVYFNGLDRFSRFMEALERPAGVVLDMGNIGFAGEKAGTFARRWADRIAHVHVKDYRIRAAGSTEKGYRLGDVMLTPALPGDGDMGVTDAVNVLRESGYAGWLMLENEAVNDPFAEQKACLERLRSLL